MLSVARAASSAGYYDQDNYYEDDGHAFSGWLGQGAAALGLEGEVDRGDYDRLYKGEITDDIRLGTYRGGEGQHYSGKARPAPPRPRPSSRPMLARCGAKATTSSPWRRPTLPCFALVKHSGATAVGDGWGGGADPIRAWAAASRFWISFSTGFWLR